MVPALPAPTFLSDMCLPGLARRARAFHNDPVQSTWPRAEEVWRRWVLLAAAHVGSDDPSAVLDDHEVLHLRHGEDWVRMRSVAGQRAVVWGRTTGHPPVSTADLLDLVPDWAVGDADAEAMAADGTTYVGWFRRGNWSRLARGPRLPAVLTDDAALADGWTRAWPDAEAEAVHTALRTPGRGAFAEVLGEVADQAADLVHRGFDGGQGPLSPAAAEHLRQVIHQQMRLGSELGDRGHPGRPVLLRQWADVNRPPGPFRFAVHAVDDLLHLSSANRGLEEAEIRSLTNVLMELRLGERDATRGAWVFAQVTGSGARARIERAYDHWPSWYVPGPGGDPRPKALAREMARRGPDWVPAWGALLPRR